jgi:hypothetical protein
MNNLDKTIKHFRSLQKRYTKTHQGEPCERVADALEALVFYRDIITGEKRLFGKWEKYENKPNFDEV